MSNNQIAISGNFDKSQANLVENTKVQPNYTQDLMSLAQQIQDADISIQSNVTNKLNIIVEQIQFLQEQAKKILEKAKLEKELHSAACNLLKKPGNVYHYYKRQSGQNKNKFCYNNKNIRYLSIMSPSDWGVSCPHEYLASYRLEYDASWVPVNEIHQVDDRKALINKLLNKTLAIEDSSSIL